MKKFRKDATSRELGTGLALTAVVIAAILAANVILYVLSLFVNIYISPPVPDEFLISGSTDALFADAIEDGRRVKVSFCYPEEDLKVHDTGSFVYRTAKQLEERYPGFIELEYINFITMRDSKGQLVDFSKYKTDELGNENRFNRSTVIFECENNYKVVTDYYSSAGFADFFTLNSSGNAVAYNGEEFFSSMVNWVLHDEHKVAYFTVSHSEQFDPTFASLLLSAGYYINTVNLREESVPKDAGLVIISNPKNDFETALEGSLVHTETERLREYIEGGGNLYVSLDPFVKRLPVLEGVLADYGIKVSRTYDNGTLADIVKDPVNAITTDGFTVVADIAEGNPLADRISSTVDKFSGGRVILRFVSALELSKDAKPLLVSSGAAVCETAGTVTRDEGNFAVAAYSETQTPSGKSAKIFVVPSLYLTVADALVTNGYANKDFLFSLYEELYGANTPPYGCNAVLYNTETLENLSMSEAYIYTAVVALVPLTLAVTGAVILIKRKNR